MRVIQIGGCRTYVDLEWSDLQVHKKTMIRLLFLSLVLIAPVASVAQQGNVPRIETSDCIYKADSLHKTWCGFLIVSENRHHPQGRTIKLPFIFVESNNTYKSPDPVLYTGGGPGVSSLHPVTSIARRSLLRDRDYIAFEQHGTHFAQPNLECEGEGNAIQNAYLEHRSVDDAVLASVRQCREKLTREGIDLSAYNTDESAADIEDLRRLLHIDSLNLMGISYSGGLMMAVLQKYPEHIRSLILDSSLPEFVNIDEQELVNFNEALTDIGAGQQRQHSSGPISQLLQRPRRQGVYNQLSVEGWQDRNPGLRSQRTIEHCPQ